MKSYMVISGEGDVCATSNGDSLFTTYEAAKNAAGEINRDAADYNRKYNVRDAYVVAVDANKPYSAIGTY